MNSRLRWTQNLIKHIFLSKMMDDLFQRKAATKAANPADGLLPNPKSKLRDQFHEVARFKHLSLRTEQSYWEWVVRYLKFHRQRAGGWTHPRDLGSTGVTPFLTGLAVQGVSISTQNQALNALLRGRSPASACGVRWMRGELGKHSTFNIQLPTSKGMDRASLIVRC
jgi:hypothetical protein